MSSTAPVVFHIAGFETCGYYVKARAALMGVEVLFPSLVKIGGIHNFKTRDEYKKWLARFVEEGFDAPLQHTSSPIVWTEDGAANADDADADEAADPVGEGKGDGDGDAIRIPKRKRVYVGGCDATLAWCQLRLMAPAAAVPTADAATLAADAAPAAVGTEAHGFEYDLVVIGGGSGGLAASKEAAKLGAKVAVLDFVKPSPAGSKWGLGGTCVNVGCIPKKLMHTAALLGEAHKEAEAFGWPAYGGAGGHEWAALRTNVQNHIKGLNFNYKVDLREKKVKYLNALGRFVDPHTLECTEVKTSKGVSTEVKTTITSRRFLVAVGGRPTPLDVPGGEHAITSDDLFMKADPPGKVCVVGAGYVALECAGFMAGLHQGDVTVLVRSMLLRGFDRDLVDKAHAHMEAHGVKILTGRVPTRVDKLPDGRLRVTMDDGATDDFDTVVAAVGRYADTKGLNLEATGVAVDPKTGKIPCIHERTNVPHIYAVGDVVAGAPELTPVAILAGRLLARRLYGQSTQLMVYTDVATTVFTPLELGTVGLSEEAAIEAHGAENIDVFASVFLPLEWTLREDRPKGVNCMAKVVVHRGQGGRVLGMHIAAPNAGEIIQGFAVAFRKGTLTHQDLLDTVGIHPTVAEEFTELTISKASGESIEKGGC